MRCPSSVRPSSVRPWLTFHIFDFSSETTEQNSTKLDRKQDLNVLYQVFVFRADRKNKMAALASDWLRHFRLLLWNRWTEFNKTWQEARSQRPLPSLCFSGRSEKQDGRPGLWLAETFSTSPLKPLNGIQQNLTGSKISTSTTKFVFFRPIGKTRWPPWPLIGWDIFHFSSETVERNSTKLDRKQDLNVLYQVCVFQADRKKKMAALASDWLRHFPLLLWKRWTEFNETWQEARSQRPLPSLCFLGRSEKQDGRPGLWLAKSFSTSPLKPLNGIQRDLTGSKISTSSTKFVFSSWSVNKMSALADSSKRWHIVLRCTICGPLGLLLHLNFHCINAYKMNPFLFICMHWYLTIKVWVTSHLQLSWPLEQNIRLFEIMIFDSLTFKISVTSCLQLSWIIWRE